MQQFTSGIRRSWIFLVYTRDMTYCTISLTYTDIYLEYDHSFLIPGICLVYAWHILSESFGVYVWYIPGICHAYSIRVIWSYAGYIPNLFLCLWIGLQQQCDWDAAAHVFWVSRVFNIQRQTWQARGQLERRSGPRCSPMWLSIDCDCFNVAAAATPEKYHDDVHTELAQCTVRK